MSLEQHPLSAAFPAMHPDDFETLARDIRANGQLEPITLYQDMVLDGWHRFKACKQFGIEPLSAELKAGVDPIVFVKSHNLHRRHLNPSQRAAAVVACYEWATVKNNQHDKSAMEPSSIATNCEMAKDADVSIKTIQQAKIAHSAGLGEKVRDGELTAKKAAQQARQPNCADADMRPKIDWKDRCGQLQTALATIVYANNEDTRLMAIEAAKKLLEQQNM